MTDKKTFWILIVTIFILVLGVYWFMARMSEDTTDTSTKETSDTVTVEDSNDDTRPEREVPQVAAPASGETDTTPSVEETLSELDPLFEEEYDDSELDAEFDGSAANETTTSYDI